MKKGHIVLIVVASVLVAAHLFFALFLPVAALVCGGIIETVSYNSTKIEIDGYRLCETEDGDEVIVIKYLLVNGSFEETALRWEGDLSVYQNGVSLTECMELPPECDYDSEDQHRLVKPGVQYYAEVAYYLQSSVTPVEVTVYDYGWSDCEQSKIFFPED